MKLGKKVFISDCEGPISVNDNAFELAGHYIEEGEKFFTILSRYDDILVDEVKREGYYAGGTLKLIIPFLKAYGATNDEIIEFSTENVLLIPGAKETLQYIKKIIPSFIVSTSYSQYIQALCNLIGFPFENTYSTFMDIDGYDLNDKDKQKLMEYRETIIKNPDFEVIDEIFWKDILELKIHEIMKNVNPVGGEGKKEAVLDIIAKFGFEKSDIMYVGDSITDVEPLKFAKENDGLAISFNGNEFAIRAAEIAIMADNTVITSIIADLFNKYGKEEVINFIKSYMNNPNVSIDEYDINNDLKKLIKQVNLPKIELITSENFEDIVNESKTFRNIVRGEAIGALG
ncbi:MAG TPA: HAD family hydrolase [Methanobacterium sp.]|nr:HAD family hydrolase [Methanobacterium sp.]